MGESMKELKPPHNVGKVDGEVTTLLRMLLDMEDLQAGVAKVVLARLTELSR